MKGSYVVYVDGDEKLQIKANAVEFETFGLQSSRGRVLYDQIRLRKME